MPRSVPASFRTCCFSSSRVEGHDAEPLLGLANFGHHGVQRLRRRGQLHLTNQRVGPRGLAGEADAEQLAHRAAAAVAADEVARAQLRAVGQLDGHPVLVLAQPDQFAATPDLDAEFGGVLGQQAIASPTPRPRPRRRGRAGQGR
jgi:hypothetical protein